MDIDRLEIEKRKQLRRDLWAYRPVDHIPVVLWLRHSFGYSLHEQLKSTQVQYTVNVERIRKALRLLPDDYIPYARVTQGYMTIATMFGMEIFWGSDPDQAPGVSGYLIDDLAQVYLLAQPDHLAGIMPENLSRLRFHAENLPPEVYLTGIDAGGPLNTCKDLLQTNLLYTGFYDRPEAMHHLLTLATEVQRQLYADVVEAAGGITRMTGIDFDPVWAPEGFKGFASDDVCAALSPRIFSEFSLPYNARLFAAWNSGLLHNCGPHPSAEAYAHPAHNCKGLNCSYRYSVQDFPRIREAFKGFGIVEVLLDTQETAEEMIAAFQAMGEAFCPDAVAIPVCMVGDDWADDDITDLYHQMRKISNEFAAGMNWSGREVLT
jgi:hypothetical protein